MCTNMILKITKLRKFDTPIVELLKISLSPQRDPFMIMHAKSPYRDFVLDAGIEGREKYSELVTTVVQEYKKLTGNNLPVEFSERIQYNNSRTTEKPGVECTVTFQQDPKVKVPTFKTGKNNANVVLYP